MVSIKCRSLFGIFLLSFLALNLFGCPGSERTSEKGEKWDITKQTIEEKAPDFALKDLEGNEIKLNDYKGKTVLLVFGTTWCPYCRAEIPYLKELYSKYRERGFDILSIDIQESIEKVSSFAAKNEIPYKVLLDSDGKVARAYGVRGVPTKTLVSKDGTILCRECRSVDVLIEEQLGESR